MNRSNIIALWVILVTFGVTMLHAGPRLNKNRTVYQASSNQNKLEGYWARENIDQAYVSYTPIGATYSFIVTPDMIEVGSYIDIPAWKHWGVIGSYGITVTDTGAAWATTADSVCVYVGINYLEPGDGQILVETVTAATSAGTSTLTKSSENFLTTVSVGDSLITYDATTTADEKAYRVTKVTTDNVIVLNSTLAGSDSDVGFAVFNDGTETHLIAMLADSAGSGNTRLGGADWINFVTGEIDLTAEINHWERIQLQVAQTSVPDLNDDVTIRVRLTLPYSQQYIDSPYFKRNQRTR